MITVTASGYYHSLRITRGSFGECVTKQAQIIRGYSPGTPVYVWSDRLDPNHKAQGNYYLVEGDFTAFMDTPWQRKCSLLPAFGDLLAK